MIFDELGNTKDHQYDNNLTQLLLNSFENPFNLNNLSLKISVKGYKFTFTQALGVVEIAFKFSDSDAR